MDWRSCSRVRGSGGTVCTPIENHAIQLVHGFQAAVNEKDAGHIQAYSLSGCSIIQATTTPRKAKCGTLPSPASAWRKFLLSAIAGQDSARDEHCFCSVSSVEGIVRIGQPVTTACAGGSGSREGGRRRADEFRASVSVRAAEEKSHCPALVTRVRVSRPSFGSIRIPLPEGDGP